MVISVLPTSKWSHNVLVNLLVKKKKKTLKKTSEEKVFFFCFRIVIQNVDYMTKKKSFQIIFHLAYGLTGCASSYVLI